MVWTVRKGGKKEGEEAVVIGAKPKAKGTQVFFGPSKRREEKSVMTLVIRVERDR